MRQRAIITAVLSWQVPVLALLTTAAFFLSWLVTGESGEVEELTEDSLKTGVSLISVF
jgi:hypothetical protein